jgi:osmoprotectant transport system ATP-binding protein
MLSIENLSKTIGGRTVLQPTTLAFATGRTTVVVGPSGCGKTTLLRLLLGLTRADAGTVVLAGERLTPSSALSLRRRVGYVIQDGGLFPHLTAHYNVTLMARFLGWYRKDVAARVTELAGLMRIEPDMLARYPKNVSGGQRQRVALMRALMLDPPVLLMDEPLGALDPMIRFELQRELAGIFARLARTVVMVTHDMHEAAHFAHEIVLMRDGCVVQRGSLEDLLQRPVDPFVTAFVRAQPADPRVTAAGA